MEMPHIVGVRPEVAPRLHSLIQRVILYFQFVLCANNPHNKNFVQFRTKFVQYTT